MKNFYDSKLSKIKRVVKKWDVHSCETCHAIERFNKTRRMCGAKNKLLDYMAVKKAVIPKWCPLEDY